MMNKHKTRKAMSLLSILALMMVVMTAIIVATPIITKRLTQIRTRGNYEKGYFMCYKYFDERTNTTKLMQIRADIYDTGTVFSGPTEVTDCQFEVPEGAESFKITLIGGGGGGAGSGAIESNTEKCIEPPEEQLPDEENCSIYPQKDTDRPRIKFNATSADIADITTAFNSYLTDASNIVPNKIKTYYTDNSVYVYTKDEENNKCLFSVSNLLTDGQYGLNKPVALEYSDLNNVNLTNVTQNLNYTYLYNSSACTRTGCNNGDSCKGVSYTRENEPSERITTLSGGAVAESVHSPSFYITYTSAKGHYGNAGLSSTPTLIETPYLRASDDSKIITISAQNIGDGGLGYNGTTCNETNNTDKSPYSGCNGGDTTLTINVAVVGTPTSSQNENEEDEPESQAIVTRTFTGKHGDGGIAINGGRLSIDNVTITNLINGQNGSAPIGNNIPIIFTSNRNIGAIQPGKGAIADRTKLSTQQLNAIRNFCEFNTTGNNVQYNVNCNGGNANYAGSGGGSAALSFKRDVSCATFNISSSTQTIDCGTGIQSNLQYAYGHGGNGAGGAILIEW